MKKFRTQVINTLMAVVLSLACGVAFTACGDDDDDEPAPTEKTGEELLIGTWYCSEEDAPDEDGEIWFDDYTLTLRSDHTGTISDNFGWKTKASTTFSYSQKFNWKYGVNSSGQEYIDFIKISGDDILEDGKYAISVINNTLKFGELTFTR